MPRSAALFFLFGGFVGALCEVPSIITQPENQMSAAVFIVGCIEFGLGLIGLILAKGKRP